MSESTHTHETAAQEIIRQHTLYAMGGSLIPIPILDLTAVTAIQLDMVKQLCNLYKIDYSESSGKAFISALTGSIMARIGASLIKGIPGIGTVLGIVSLAGLSGAATYALGEVFLRHLSEGGTFKDFDAEAYQKYYQERYEEGKQQAKTWKDEADAAKAEAEVDPQAASLQKLKELGELKAAGHITKKEFDEMKKKIVGEFKGEAPTEEEGKGKGKA
ncbi:MAG: DUF697 domain-containing protein [Bacteroidota bacterium]